MKPKSSFEHFFGICHGKKEFDETYNPDVINNLFANYEDTVKLSSYMADIGRTLNKRHHYELYQLLVSKGARATPTYLKANKES